MARNGYIGVNNAPRKIVDMYIGINNQPRRVLKAYIGDERNQPRLWYYFYPPEPLDYNSIYYKYNSGTFTTFGGRWYAKVNDGETYAFSAWLPENWTFGFVVSQYKKAVESNCSYQSGYIHKADGSGGGSFVMYNHLWYWTHAPFAWQGCYNCDPQTNFIDFRSNSNIPATHDFIEYETVCKEFLKLIYENRTGYNTNSKYYMYGTGHFCTIGGRDYTKNNVGEAYVGCFYSSSGWGCPILVSLKQSNCIASDFPGPNAVVGTVTYNGNIWYVSNVGAAIQSDPSDQTIYIGSGYTTDSNNFSSSAALELLRRVYET